jgi:nucleoside-diphosphate-sugar epimerase
MAHPLARDLDHILAQTSEVWDAFRGEQVFITGGTGFVGTWLVESFAWANDRFDLKAKATVLTRNPDAFRVKAPYSANHRAVRLLQGSMQTFEFPWSECAFIIHAATDQILPSAAEPAGTFDRELSGTRRVLKCARECGARRVLFTSSGAVYGKQPPELTHLPEEYAGAPSPTDTSSAYGEAKRASEFLCAAYAQQYGFAAVIARLFAFAGPYLPLDSNFAVGNFVRDVLAGGPIRIAGDGTAYRSYLYAADLAIWLWNLLVRGESARPYNVGSPDAITIQDLAQLIVDTVSPGIAIEIAGQPNPTARPARYVPSVDRAAKEIGLRAMIPLDEQIRRMYEWNRLLSSP